MTGAFRAMKNGRLQGLPFFCPFETGVFQRVFQRSVSGHRFQRSADTQIGALI